MATRVFLRRNGSSEPGCMAKLPPTWAELLAVADAKLYKQPGSGTAKRLFAVSGDEILDDDYDLIESNDILYMSAGEDWRAPMPVAVAACGTPMATPQPAAPLPAEPADSAQPPPAAADVEAPEVGAPAVAACSPSASAIAAPASPASSCARQVAGEGDAVSAPASAPREEREGPGGGEGEEEEEELGDELYCVEAILAQRGASPSREFLISWQGYTDVANSWEPEANILDAEMIAAFEAREAAELAAMDEADLRVLVARAGLHAGATDAGRDALLAAASAARAILAPQPSGREQRLLSTTWVCCNKCEKWRRLPAGARPPPAGEFWECSMNPPDVPNCCIMPQESMRDAGRGRESMDKLRQRLEREAEREAARQQKLAERLERDAARAAERAKKEEEKKRREAERAEARAVKEEERLQKEAAKEEARQQRAAEAAAREEERQEELRRQEEAAKRQRINKFFFVKPTALAPARPAESARAIVLRDGKHATQPSAPDECTVLAAQPHRRPPSTAGAPRYLAAHVDFLFGLSDDVPRMPPPMRAVCRRERRVRVGRAEPAWKWANVKLLCFHEDVRPPYRGTFTRKRDRADKGEPEDEDEDAGANPFALGDDFAQDAFGLGDVAAGDAFGLEDHADAAAGEGGESGAVAAGARAAGDGGADGDSGAVAGDGEEADARKPLGSGGVSRRRPFGRDATLFDYEYDSEAEWEPEEEQGEDLMSDEEPERDGAADEGEEGEEDDWLVPDDPMDDERTMVDLDADEGAAAATASGKKGGARLQPTLLLAPSLGAVALPTALAAYRVVKAPHVAPPGEPSRPTDPAVAALLDTPLERSEPVDWNAPAGGRSGKAGASKAGGAADGADGDGGTPRAGAPVRAVPADQLPRLLELVHGAKDGMAKLVELFQEGTPEGVPAASKAQIEKQIRAVATKGVMPGVRGACWSVLDATWAALGLSPPAPRTAPSDGAAAAGKGDGKADGALTSCVLPSRATDVLNPAMRSFFSKGAAADGGATANADAGAGAAGEVPVGSSAAHVGASAGAGSDGAEAMPTKVLFVASELDSDDEEAERREEEEAIRAAQRAAAATSAVSAVTA